MKKILLLLFLLCITKSVKADNFYYDVDKIDEYYVTRIGPDISMSSNVYFLNDKETGDFFYCIEPLLLLDQSVDYIKFETYNSSINISDEMFYKLNLIANYGYGYKNHTDLKWYVVTQYLIWKTIYPEYDIYFASGKFGDRLDILNDEINELNKLVSNDLNGLNIKDEYKVTTGREYVLFESNYLDKYIFKTDIKYEIKDNKFIIKPSKSGSYSVNVKRKKNKGILLFYSPLSQNIFRPGDLDKVLNFTIRVITKDLKIIKKDKETGETLKGVLFGLYDVNDNLIDTKRTDLNGIVIFNNLSIDKYYVKELEGLYGYYLDDTKYEMDLNRFEIAYLYNEKIKKEFTLTKLYQSDTLKEEVGAKFLLYKDDELMGEYVTDIDGHIKLKLEYGNYKLVQTEGLEGFYLADPMEFSICDDCMLDYTLINKPIESTSIITIEVPDTLK